ncbi:MAG: hemolysin family protein [Chlamydiota bacterium]
MESWKQFLFFALFCIVAQSFFAMMEMACVSFNKVRLQYYISKRDRSAICLQYLLSRPALLFGTTLVCVNAALLIGSECSRKFYEGLGTSPFWAPITQAFLVLIFAEIAPMFAGRRYAEHAVMLGVTTLYVMALILRPFVWMIDLFCKWIHKFFGSEHVSEVYLSREELQNVIEAREETYFSQEKDELNTVVDSIFSLKNKIAKELMLSLKEVKMLSSQATLAEIRPLLQEEYTPYVPLFHKERSNIVAIAYPRDLLRLTESKRIREHARAPWFIAESATILQILKQFRKNNQSVAVVLNQTGAAVGILTLDEIVDEIFGRKDQWMSFVDIGPSMHQIALDRAFPGDMLLKEFKEHYHVDISFKHAKTLAQAMELALGHIPREGENVRIDQFELIVEETTLLGPKTILVRTLRN